jgi:hypothetical protein
MTHEEGSYMPTIKDWLLEQDESNPSVRYLALTDLLHRSPSDPDVLSARQAVMDRGPVPAILSAQDPAGFWVQPGAGYYPKYRGSVWSAIYLSQLGADPADPRVRAAGDYILDNAIASTGVFTATGTPAGNIHCLAGNLGAALLDLGFAGDPRLQRALELLARFVTGEGIASDDQKDAPLHYYRSGTCGPGFRCSANGRLPCAWGAVKILRALSRVPASERTPTIQAALESTVEFLFSVDPAGADYPAGYSDKPSQSWFRFGFPLFYVTDVLQTGEALTDAGYGGDSRLTRTYDLILSKRDSAGRWRLAYAYTGKTWADVEARGKPSKWVTLRALRVLEAGGIEA